VALAISIMKIFSRLLPFFIAISRHYHANLIASNLAECGKWPLNWLNVHVCVFEVHKAD